MRTLGVEPHDCLTHKIVLPVVYTDGGPPTATLVRQVSLRNSQVLMIPHRLMYWQAQSRQQDKYVHASSAVIHGRKASVFLDRRPSLYIPSAPPSRLQNCQIQPSSPHGYLRQLLPDESLVQSPLTVFNSLFSALSKMFLHLQHDVPHCCQGQSP